MRSAIDLSNIHHKEQNRYILLQYMQLTVQSCMLQLYAQLMGWHIHGSYILVGTSWC